MRELTHYLKSIIEGRSRELSRLQKVLEGANIKLGSVVKDIQGKSAGRLLEHLAVGKAMNTILGQCTNYLFLRGQDEKTRSFWRR